MKRIHYSALALFATLALGSCSNDEPGGGQDKSDGETRYLSVNIVPTSTNGSRADSSNDGGYENGVGLENEVKNVRFYFFTDAGDAASVKLIGGEYKNYYDWTNTGESTSGSNGSNVEKTLNPVLVISTPEGDKLPGQIVAVINPNISKLGSENLGLDQLRLKFDDYAERATGTDGSFVMMNSVYANGNEVIKSTKLTRDNFKSTAEAAKGAPVDIYVERCVAKVRAQYNKDLVFENNGLIRAKMKGKDGNPDSPITIHGATEEIDVYVRVEGWNLTYTMPACNLSKHIDLRWNNNTIGSNIAWNRPDDHRSLWAAENEIDNAPHVKIPWNSAKAQKFGTGNVYANENAERSGELEATNIMVAATLCDKNGNALTVCEYAGLKFADDDNFSALKAMLLTYLNNGGVTYYKKETVEGGVKYVKIAPEDITFIQNTSASKDMYNVYAVLASGAQADVWGTASSEEEEITEESQVTPVSATLLNEALKKLGYIQIYNKGMSYYYAPVKHYTRDGIVRNHIYDITVDGFYGMGTPVYDPTWSIILEKPKSDDSFLAARINILSWHLMLNHVTFE